MIWTNLLILAVAILPGLLISIAVFYLDRYEQEPWYALTGCFLLGGMATFPAVGIEQAVFPWIHDATSGLLQTVLISFFAIALNEELWKILAVMLGAWPWRWFDEPLDGIVYAVLVAMGFATTENLFYADRFGLDVIILRALTAVPAHLVFALIFGFHLGQARFLPANQAWQRILRGALLAVLFHGVYDFLILQSWSEWLLVLGTSGLYLGIYYGSWLFSEHLENSPFK